jgi:hypothetical protein
MKTQLRISRREGAFTYMTVVITMIVVGLMLAAYLKMVSVQNQLTMRSQIWNRSVPVLEAGIEEAIAHLNKNASPDAAGNWSPNMLADGWSPDADGGWHKTGQIGEDIYWVRIEPWPIVSMPSNFPSISATGFVKQTAAYAFNNSFRPFLAASTLETLLAARKTNYSSRIVQATTTNLPTFTRGLVARHIIDLNGKNVMTDSYDSSIPAYNTGGRYDSTKSRDHGDIGSNDTITNTVNVGNATIKGNVSTGPLGTVAIGSGGVIGDSNYVANPANQGTVQSGHSRDDLNVEFPSVPMPTNSGSWLPLPLPANYVSPVDGLTYKYVLPTGNYYIPADGGNLDGKSYLIQGNVQLRVDSGINMTGQDTIRLDTNSTLKIYANCASASVGGNGIINPNLSSSLYIFGTPICKSINLGGNADFTGVIYAPSADLSMNGSGGSSDNDFSGAAMVNSAKFNGNFKFHFDEALPKKGLWHGFVLTSWNER